MDEAGSEVRKVNYMKIIVLSLLIIFSKLTIITRGRVSEHQLVHAAYGALDELHL